MGDFDALFPTNASFAAFNKLVNKGGEFEWRDRGLKAIIAKLEGAGRSRLEVGLVGSASQTRYPGAGGLTVGQVGLINEFGSKDGHVPRRSFLRATMVEHQSTILRWLREAAQLGISRRDKATLDDALHYVGERVVSLVKAKIASHPAPANAPRTIKRKGFDGALEQFGFLINAVTHRVVRKINVEGASSASVTTEGSQRAASLRKRGEFNISSLRHLVGEAAIRAIGLK